MDKVKLVYVGDRYYWESGTIMSSLIEEETGDRSDWGKVSALLRDGKTVEIRPATKDELKNMDEKLLKCKKYLEN